MDLYTVRNNIMKGIPLQELKLNEMCIRDRMKEQSKHLFNMKD